MSFPTPSYIPVSEISQYAVTHVWDDWDPYDPIDDADQLVKNSIAKVSNFGAAVFSLGCAEWVLYRLSQKIGVDKTPYQYIEAFWSCFAGIPQALPPPTENENWIGPIRGPINLALMTTLNVIYLSEDAPAEEAAAFAPQIVRHVLPDEYIELFNAWERDVLERLQLHYPRNKNDPDGPPVPREILDPRVKFSTELRLNLCTNLLSQVDLQNPFLEELVGQFPAK